MVKKFYSGLEAVTFVLNFDAEVTEVMETSENAEPLPLSLGDASEELPPPGFEPPPPGLVFVELTLMTVFMAALLLLKSQTSITESSSPLVVVRVAANKIKKKQY